MMRRLTAQRFATAYRVTDGTLVVDLGRIKRVLSSAPCGGGLQSARFIINHQVKDDPITSRVAVVTSNATQSPQGDPAMALRRVASRVGVRGPLVGLMTAVPMKQLVASREESHGCWMECIATVGVTNGVRAGERFNLPVMAGHAVTIGTINIIVVTNAALAVSAMVGAIQVVTESKTGVLRDHGIPCWDGTPGATGTGTDAVVLACAKRGAGPWHRYSGMHTMIGIMIGQVVGDCVAQGLARARQWEAKRQRQT